MPSKIYRERHRKNEPEKYYGRSEVRVVVVGDPDTGKSTLISYVHRYLPRYDDDDDDVHDEPDVIAKELELDDVHAYEEPDIFAEDNELLEDDYDMDAYDEANDMPDVVETKALPKGFHPDSYPLPVIAIYTSSNGFEDKENIEKLKQADVIVLTFARDKAHTFITLYKIWIPVLKRLEIKAPIIVAGCKMDLKDEDTNLDSGCWHLNQIENIVKVFECSAFSLNKIHEVFCCAQKLVLEPSIPLYDVRDYYSFNPILMPKLRRSLKRIFLLYDHDKDGIVKFEDFKKFQVKCFGYTIVEHVQKMLTSWFSRYHRPIHEDGLTFEGFTYFILNLYKKEDYDTMWIVLRQFGYNNDLQLSDFLISSSTVGLAELSNEAIKFLRWIFNWFELDNNGTLTQNKLIELFDMAPQCPFAESPYKYAVEKNGLSLNGFLLLWSLMKLLDPSFSMKNLLYIGYGGELTSAISVTRKSSSIDCQLQQQSGRNVFQRFVFSPKNSGKSTLLDSFLKRSLNLDNTYTPTSNDSHYAVNVVDQCRKNKKFLVLKEFPEDTVDKLLSSGGKAALAACDVAVFVYDTFDVSSKNGATNLLKKVAQYCKDNGFEVPFKYVAAKNCSLSFVIQQVS